MSVSILDRYMGVEDLDLSGELNSEVVAVAEEAARAEVAEATVEMQEAAEQVQELTETVCELEEAVEELEEVVEGMESLIGSGNFNGMAFAHMYNRAAKLSGKLGGSVGSRMGAENFSDAATAQVAARDGMEGFAETIKGYGTQAVAFIKNIFNAVIAFFVGLFNKAEGLSKRAGHLVDRLAATKELKKEIKLGGWNAWIDYAKNGSAGPGTDWEAVLGSVAALADATKADGFNLSAFKSAYTALVTEITGKVIKGNKKTKGEADKKTTIGEHAGVLVQVSFNDGSAINNEEDAIKAVRDLKVFVAKAAQKNAKPTAKVKDDKSALGATLTSVKAAAQKMKESKVSKKFSAAERDRVIGMLNATKGDSEEASKQVKKTISLLKATYAAAAAVTKTLAGAATSTLDAQLSCVAAHI